MADEIAVGTLREAPREVHVHAGAAGARRVARRGR
jgi:hypothetical protein